MNRRLDASAVVLAAAAGLLAAALFFGGGSDDFDFLPDRADGALRRRRPRGRGDGGTDPPAGAGRGGARVLRFPRRIRPLERPFGVVVDRARPDVEPVQPGARLRRIRGRRAVRRCALAAAHDRDRSRGRARRRDRVGPRGKGLSLAGRGRGAGLAPALAGRLLERARPPLRGGSRPRVVGRDGSRAEARHADRRRRPRLRSPGRSGADVLAERDRDHRPRRARLGRTEWRRVRDARRARAGGRGGGSRPPVCLPQPRHHLGRRALRSSGGRRDDLRPGDARGWSGRRGGDVSPVDPGARVRRVCGGAPCGRPSASWRSARAAF